MNFIHHLQWPAMLVTLVAAWLVASNQERNRKLGFWVFLLSNSLWIIWALHDGAWALMSLQVGLAAMNIRGAVKANKKMLCNFRVRNSEAAINPRK